MKRVSKEISGSPNWLVTKFDELVNWARANSLWPMPFGTACCAIEFMATAASRFDFARFGMERQAFSPRQADVLICAGRLPFKLAPVIRRVYDQMPQPKWVISMGACASTGGIFDNYAMVQGIDTIVPVDVYVPGCPPRPEGLLYGVLLLHKKIKGESLFDRVPRREEQPLDDRGLRLPPEQIDEISEPFGNTIVYVAREALLDAMTWLRDTPEQGYDYLVDVTAVEYRDRERPLEVVYNLRSLARRTDLRVKVELDLRGDLAIDSVVPLWRGADWLEREVYDMFGVTFRGHPDLRRILMWETYAEGYPLRKDFPLRGRFSRAEQVRQALGANPEAHYSMEELSIAEAYDELPADIKERLRRGERGKLPDSE